MVKINYTMGGFDEMFKFTSGNPDMSVKRGKVGRTDAPTGITGQFTSRGGVHLRGRSKKEDNLLVAGRMKYPSYSLDYRGIAMRLTRAVMDIRKGEVPQDGYWKINPYDISDFINAVEYARSASLSSGHFDNNKIADAAVEQLQKSTSASQADELAELVLTGRVAKPSDYGPVKHNSYLARAATRMGGLTDREKQPDGAKALFTRSLMELLKAKLEDSIPVPDPKQPPPPPDPTKPPIGDLFTNPNGTHKEPEKLSDLVPPKDPEPGKEPDPRGVEDDLGANGMLKAVDDLIDSAIEDGDETHKNDQQEGELHVPHEAQPDPERWESERIAEERVHIRAVLCEQVPSQPMGISIPDSDDGIPERGKVGTPTSDLWRASYGDMRVFNATGQTAPRRLTILVDCSGSTVGRTWEKRKSGTNMVGMPFQMLGWSIAAQLLRLSPESESFGFCSRYGLTLYSGQKPGLIPVAWQGGGGTPTASALIWAYERAHGNETSVVLITDDDPDSSAAGVAAELRNRGVTLGVIGFPNYHLSRDSYDNASTARARFHGIGFPADLSAYYTGKSDVHMLSELFDNIMA